MLRRYEEKRDFARTPEPAPKPGSGEGPLLFVVQKHAARRLHYDFRLELDGVLKSWSVPNGPSLDPKTKRLAVMVEDHPLDYAGFEGTIPRGEYGAGEVIVWDTGSYSPEEHGQLFFHDRARAQSVMRESLARGKVSIVLRGHKLKGSWALVKMQHREKDWLFIKHRDEFADPEGDILAEERSVVSGLGISDLKAGSLPAGLDPAATAEIPGARKSTFPLSLSPMLATPTDAPFSSPDWLYEPKLDGYRTLAYLNGGRIKLLSRRQLDVTVQYPFLVEDLKLLSNTDMVLDGEIVALDEAGRPCFQCLQQHLEAQGTGSTPEYPIVYYVFDILYLDGYDLSSAALDKRRRLLERVLHPSDHVRLVEQFEGDGRKIYEAAVSIGFEGVIAKRRDSTYEPGRRSKDWLKVKAVHSEDFVICGFSKGEGDRAATFGALVLGYFNGGGKLVFAGHVGSGFDEAALTDLRRRLEAIKIDACPFAEVPPLHAPVTWVRPELVAEVKFTQWTQEGYLRNPVFLRLREDKAPAEVRRVSVASHPGSGGR